MAGGGYPSAGSGIARDHCMHVQYPFDPAMPSFPPSDPSRAPAALPARDAGGPIPAPGLPPGRRAAALEALRVGGVSLPLWRAGQMDDLPPPTVSSGWPALDAELPGGGWPLQGLFELLTEPASGELTLLAPWLRALSRRELGPRELLWVAPPARPCVAALQALGMPASRLVCVEPASAADAAWAVEQALRAGSCAAVLWWSTAPCAIATLRRLHLAAQAGGTPLVALRLPVVRDAGSPAPLRVACSAESERRLAVEVFKRRGPPMAAPLAIALPWPAAARRVVPPSVRATAGPVPSVPSVPSVSVPSVSVRSVPAELPAASKPPEVRRAVSGATAAVRPVAPQPVERV